MINPTPEQQAVIDWRGEKLVVNAFAGTGKTSTLVKYAEKHPELRMLYIAFNRSVREEADEKFPANVLCGAVAREVTGCLPDLTGLRFLGDLLRAIEMNL